MWLHPTTLQSMPSTDTTMGCRRIESRHQPVVAELGVRMRYGYTKIGLVLSLANISLAGSLPTSDPSPEDALQAYCRSFEED